MSKRTRPRPRGAKGGGRGAFVRRQAPKLEHQGEKLTAILCPFCEPTHPIYVSVPAPCGTVLELEAVQVAYSGVRCYVCGQMGGTLIKVGDAYRHAVPCKPGERHFTVPPKPSRLAGALWRLPTGVHRWIGRTFNRLPTEIKRDNGTTYHVMQDASLELAAGTLRKSPKRA